MCIRDDVVLQFNLLQFLAPAGKAASLYCFDHCINYRQKDLKLNQDLFASSVLHVFAKMLFVCLLVLCPSHMDKSHIISQSVS